MIEWNAAAVLNLRREVAMGLLRAAVFLQNTHRQRLNVSNPRPHKNPAPRGDYPRARTGHLRDTIWISPTSPTEVEMSLRIRVGYMEKYGAFLDLKGWKGLADTVQDLRPQLAAFIAAKAA